MSGVHKRHVGPQPWEQAPYDLWDRLEAEARVKGNRAANVLAMKALAAVEPPKEKSNVDTR